MKGLELPMSTIVVVIVVLLVLVAILTLFYGTWPGGSETATLESVKTNACQMLISVGGCKQDMKTKEIVINNFDADKDGTVDGGITSTITCNAPLEAMTKDSLFMLCKCWYGLIGAEATIDENCRKNVCSCP